MDELLLNFPDKFPLSVHQAYKKQEEEIRKKNAKKQAAAAQGEHAPHVHYRLFNH